MELFEKSEFDGKVYSFMNKHINSIPLSLFVIFSALLFYSWQIITTEEEKRIETEINGHLQHFSTQIKSHFQSRFALTKVLVQKWAEGRINTYDDFKSEAIKLHEIYPDFQAINWINNQKIITWVTPYHLNKGAQGLNIQNLKIPHSILQDSLEHQSLRTTPPIKLAQGGNGFVGYHPLYYENKLDGFLNIVFRTEPAVEAALHKEFMDKFYLNIFDGARSLLSTVHNLDDSPQSLTNEILVGSRVWRLEIALKPKYETTTLKLFINYIYITVGLFIISLVSLLIRSLMQRHLILLEQERRFKDLATISSDWFWELDKDLRFTYISPRYTELTGDSIDNKIGKKRWELDPSNSSSIKWQKHIEDLKAHRAFKNFEIQATWSKQKKAFYRINGVPIFDKSGQFLGYRGSASDITDIKTAETMRILALEEAERANRSKSEFLATMSHELRTPLNAIIGFSDLIKRQVFGMVGNKTYIEYANDIHKSGEHLLGLINDILDISAIEAGKRSFRPEEIDLFVLCESCTRYITPLLEKKNIHLKINKNFDTYMLFADERSIRQIFINLLSNAIKFNRENGTIIITLNAREKGDKIEIHISDTGIGIPAENINSITSPFERGKTHPHLAQEGTGLGLSIVKSLVESHGGTLEINSEEHVGTTVIVTFFQHTTPINP